MGNRRLHFPQAVGLSLLVVLAFWSTLISAAEVYKTVDENGRITYTDTPPQGQKAEKVELPEVNSLPPTQARPRSEAPVTVDTMPRRYSVAITQPEPETHVNPGQRDLSVQAATSPPLHPRHRIEILDNGSPLPSSGGSVTIENIFRGTHTLSARVLNEAGEVLGQSDPIQVYVHRPTANSVLRQKPKPVKP